MRAHLGQTVNGALLSIDITPVGVGLEVVSIPEVTEAEAVPDSVAEEDSDSVSCGSCEKFNDGQHSGRSSEQPIKGTSKKAPFGKVRMVN